MPPWMVYLIAATCCSQLCSAAWILASRNRAIGAVPFSVRVVLGERFPCGAAHHVHQAAHKGSDSDCRSLWQGHTRSAVFLPPLDLFVGEAANNSKTFAVCFDVTEWVPCSLQLSSIRGKIISRALGEERC